jgi:acyl carrier protein
MDSNKFLENFVNQFEEEDLKITMNTKFRELDSWDSMTSLMVISMLDEEYNSIVSSEIFENFEIVEDIFKHINK